MGDSLSSISVVLVGPQGSANIGATARAIKNFGITDLRIVSGVSHLTKDALMWACDAKDLLTDAKKFNTLDDALADTTFAIAFTRRIGRARKLRMTLREIAPLAIEKAECGRVALVFGREDSGLTTDEVLRCDATASIPTSTKLPSINLAQATLLAASEIFETHSSMRTGKRTCAARSQVAFLPKGEVKNALERLREMLETLGYTDSGKGKKSRILKQIEKIFGRAGLTYSDSKMIEGLTMRIINSAKHPGPTRT